ncbi:MAG: hypothetical protein H8E86_07870 [Planctomycetes bacterium]|nr:hypothetical protein [Planctomycetota bacterium]
MNNTNVKIMKTIATTTALLGICVFTIGCNERTQNSNILTALTPNMQTLDSTYPEDRANEQVTNNANDRLFHGDSERFWMVDSPSTLTPKPVVRN